MRAKRLLYWNTDLPAIGLVLWEDCACTVRFNNGPEGGLEASEFHFELEGRDGRSVTQREFREHGGVMDPFRRQIMLGMLAEIYGPGVTTFVSSNSDTRAGIYVPGRFQNKEIPEGWSIATCLTL
jgi:hypothetical protein